MSFSPETASDVQVINIPSPLAIGNPDGVDDAENIRIIDTAHVDNAKPVLPGAGGVDDPYIVDWELNDPENPYNWPNKRKWIITLQLAAGTWTVSFGSSAYSGGLYAIMDDFHISQEVAVLGISLYVLGFGLGPLVFAPCSEMYGRRLVFLTTFSVYTLFHLGGIAGHNFATLLACRLLSGTFGASLLTNAGGAVSDIWSPRERGMATALYSTATFLGPVIGPIVGGYVVENRHLGWRFIFWLMFIFSIGNLICGTIITPETYGPVLLRRRAKKLCKESGGSLHYLSHHDISRETSFSRLLRINLSRPFRFLFTEPIVTLLAVYISIAYATLYALFAAYPIVFQEHRHFTPGEGGLAFLGVGVGIVMGTITIPVQNRIYWRAMERSDTGRAPPEARLYCVMMGGVLLPLGLFWFAWTTEPSIHWIVPILAGIPFGISVTQILQGLIAYLMDAYTIYFASAVGATIVLRSMCAAAFPLFSPVMYRALGDQWACSVFAFLSLVCMPVPVLFWKYGQWIRSKSQFAYIEESQEHRSIVPSSPITVMDKEQGESDVEKA